MARIGVPSAGEQRVLGLHGRDEAREALDVTPVQHDERGQGLLLAQAVVGRHAAGEQLLDAGDHAAVHRLGGVEEQLEGHLAGVRTVELRRACGLGVAGVRPRPPRRLRDRQFLRVELERDPVDRGARLAAARDGLRLVQLQGGAGEVRRWGTTRPAATGAVQGDRLGGHRSFRLRPAGSRGERSRSSRSRPSETRRSGWARSSGRGRRLDRFHVATASFLAFRATIVAVRRLTPVVMLANHLAIFFVSGPSGRLSLTFVYFRRVGSCHT